MTELTKSDRRILHILKEFKCFSKDQLNILYAGYNPNKTAYIIRRLHNERQIFYSKNKDYLLSLPGILPDSRIRDAFFVFGKHTGESADTYSLYRPESISTLGYIKNGKLYEVVATNNEEELMIAANELSKREKESGEENFVTYIFVIKRRSAIKNIKNIEVPHVIALLDYMDGISIRAIPNITFYAKGE